MIRDQHLHIHMVALRRIHDVFEYATLSRFSYKVYNRLQRTIRRDINTATFVYVNQIRLNVNRKRIS